MLHDRKQCDKCTTSRPFREAPICVYIWLCINLSRHLHISLSLHFTVSLSWNLYVRLSLHTRVSLSLISSLYILPSFCFYIVKNNNIELCINICVQLYLLYVEEYEVCVTAQYVNLPHHLPCTRALCICCLSYINMSRSNRVVSGPLVFTTGKKQRNMNYTIFFNI